MINSASPVCNCMVFQGSASASAGFIDQYFGGEFESEYPCLPVAAGCGCLGHCCVATGVPHTLPGPSQALFLLWIGASTRTHTQHTHTLPGPSQALLLLWIGASTHTHTQHTHTLPGPSQALLLLWIGASTHTQHTHTQHTHTAHTHCLVLAKHSCYCGLVQARIHTQHTHTLPSPSQALFVIVDWCKHAHTARTHRTHTLPSTSQALLLLWIGASTHTQHTQHTHTHTAHTHTQSTHTHTHCLVLAKHSCYCGLVQACAHRHTHTEHTHTAHTAHTHSTHTQQTHTQHTHTHSTHTRTHCLVLAKHTCYCGLVQARTHSTHTQHTAHTHTQHTHTQSTHTKHTHTRIAQHTHTQHTHTQDTHTRHTTHKRHSHHTQDTLTPHKTHTTHKTHSHHTQDTLTPHTCMHVRTHAHRIQYGSYRDKKPWCWWLLMLVDSLTVTRMRCKEAPDEDVTVSREKFFQLSCFIDQGRNNTHTGVLCQPWLL